MEKIKKRNIINLGLGKVPPQSIELEEAVLGACMLEVSSFETVMSILSSGDCFYMDAHQKIYNAICRLYNEGFPLDLLTVTEELRRANELEIIGGAYYLSRLTMSVLTSAHVQAHAQVVFEKFMSREFIRVCGAAISDAYEDATDVFQLQDRILSEINGITEGITGDDDITVGEALLQVQSEYQIQKERKSALIGVTTGLYDYDDILGGWKTPSLNMLAAQPSKGKTALMLNLAHNAAVAGTRSKIFSLETGAMNLTRRMAASKLRISFSNLQKGILSEEQEYQLVQATHEFFKLKISISYKTFYIEDIVKSIRKEQKKHPDLGLIFIDFIQLIRLRNNPNKMNKFEIIGEVSRVLKLLSAELSIPIIALSQVNRDTNKNAGKRPEAQNLANSSELEQNADTITFIHYAPSEDNNLPEPMLIIAKNKDGACGDIKVKFDGDIQHWFDYEDGNQNVLPSYVQAQAATYVNNSQAMTPDENAPW